MTGCSIGHLSLANKALHLTRPLSQHGCAFADERHRYPLNVGGIMNDQTGNSAKQKSPKIHLVLGMIWLALGVFGLTFDPSNRLMGIIQLSLGLLILMYYFWVTLK